MAKVGVAIPVIFNENLQDILKALLKTDFIRLLLSVIFVKIHEKMTGNPWNFNFSRNSI